MKRLPFNLERAKSFHAGRMSRMWLPMKKQPDGLFEGKYPYTLFNSDGPYVKAIIPPYHPGETAYIAEPWTVDEYYDGQQVVFYRATDHPDCGQPWRSPALMPEWASRSKARILSCVPKRCQDITEEEAIKEVFFGCVLTNPSDDQCFLCNCIRETTCWKRKGYKEYIESIYPGAWSKDLWGWAVEFEKEGK